MNSIRGVLIDLSGTLHVGDVACEGAVEGLKRLRLANIPFRFCTNTTKESCEKLLKKLTGLGFEIHKNEIFTSLIACRNLVQSRKLRPMLFLEEAAMEDFKEIDTSKPNDSVVIGLSPSKFNYEKLNSAFRILISNPDAPLIAIHKGKYFAENDGLSLGPGAFVEALEYAANVKSTIVGKPERSFYELALKDMGLLHESERVVMIGDDISQDLGSGARELGLVRFLVRTGKYRPDDEQKDGSINGVFDNFGVAVDRILKGLVGE